MPFETPVVFMHIPKTAGISVDNALRRALSPIKIVRGIETALLGSYGQLETISDQIRKWLFDENNQLNSNADYASGHFTYRLLRQAYPHGRFITILREPWCRLISVWVFLRSLPDYALVPWGTFSVPMMLARSRFEYFLADQRMSSSIDNVLTRYLLHPHPLIPTNGYIEPESDAELLAEAIATLNSFSFVGVVEDGSLGDKIGAWLGSQLVIGRDNQTKVNSERNKSSMYSELTPTVFQMLERLSRIDKQLWIRNLPLGMLHDVSDLRAQLLMSSVARYDAILRGN